MTEQQIHDRAQARAEAREWFDELCDSIDACTDDEKLTFWTTFRELIDKKYPREPASGPIERG